MYGGGHVHVYVCLYVRGRLGCGQRETCLGQGREREARLRGAGQRGKNLWNQQFLAAATSHSEESEPRERGVGCGVERTEGRPA